MTIAAYRGRCPHCGHDHDQILFHTSDREELDRLRAEVASLQGKLDSAINVDIKWRDAEIKELREKKFTRFNEQECWIYQGDGQDNLQTLACPVVIAPEVLLDLTQQLTAVTDECKAWAGLVKARNEQLATAHKRIKYLETLWS